jgi:hypothetical protein
MKDRNGKQYCTLDHANKRRELARQTPYEFWLRQVSRRGTGQPVQDGVAVKHRRSGN